MKVQDVLGFKKARLLHEVAETLTSAEYPLPGLEIGRRILVKYCGEDWHEQKGAYDVFRRLGRRIIGLLSVTEHGDRNRERLGIGFRVSDLANHPLEFYLKKALSK